MNVSPCGDEISVPGLKLRRSPQPGFGGPCQRLRPVVYEAEGVEVAQDSELISRGDREPHLMAEVSFQPGFQVWSDPGVVAGHEVDVYLLLHGKQDLGSAGVRFPLPDARRVEDAVEDLCRGRFPVGVEKVNPGVHLFRVEDLAHDLEHRSGRVGGRVPDRRVHVYAEGPLQGWISSSTGMASVRPPSGSTTA